MTQPCPWFVFLHTAAVARPKILATVIQTHTYLGVYATGFRIKGRSNPIRDGTARRLSALSRS
jgi:hypothetical protein